MQGICLPNFKSSEVKGEEKGLLKVLIGKTCTEGHFAQKVILHGPVETTPSIDLVGETSNRKNSARKIKKDSEPPKVFCLLPDNFPNASLVKVKQYYEISSHHQHFRISKEFKSYTHI